MGVSEESQMVIRHWNIRAHYDGKVIVPDEPIELPPGTSVSVTVEVVRGAAIEPDVSTQSSPAHTATENVALMSEGNVFPAEHVIRVKRGGETFVLPMPPDRACITVAELIDLGWLAPLDDGVTLLDARPVGPADQVHAGQTLEQVPTSGRLGSGAEPDRGIVENRKERLARAIGVLDAPPPPPESLRRDALYGDGS